MCDLVSRDLGCWAQASDDDLETDELWRQIIRPKWSKLYAARRKQRNAASRLPELPKSLFGWIPVVWRITDEEVLESAGMDAYVVSRDT
jgi:Uncharacterized integral membrane protein